MPDLSELIKAIDRQTYVLSVIAKELCLLIHNNVGAREISGHLIDEMEETLRKEANHGSS